MSDVEETIAWFVSQMHRHIGHINYSLAKLESALEKEKKKENKMINVNTRIDDYCHDCPEFESDCQESCYYSDNEKRIKDVYITCKHRNKCVNIRNYLEKIFKPEEDDLK